MRSVFTLSTQAPTLVAATAILAMQMCGPGFRQQTSASLANDMRRKGQPLLDEILRVTVVAAKTCKLYIINSVDILSTRVAVGIYSTMMYNGCSGCSSFCPFIKNKREVTSDPWSEQLHEVLKVSARSVSTTGLLFNPW